MVEQKSKKFVFNVYEENVPFVESLSYEQKNQLINRLLHEHQIITGKEENSRNFIKFLKRISILLFVIIAGIPLFIMSINFCFDLTLNSYSRMERNFERLFNEQQR